MDLSVVYRAYIGETDGKLNSVRPPWFDKFKCWRSFYNEFGGKSKIIVIWDGEPEGSFYEYIKSFDVEISNYGKMGNKGTLIKTYEILKQEIADVLCTWEDDYLVRSGCYEAIEEGFLLGFKLITPYEHMDLSLIHI